MLKFIAESNEKFTKDGTYEILSSEGSAMALIENDIGDQVWVSVDERWVA